MSISDENRVDKAISEHLKTWWTDETKQEIKVQYGIDILNQIISIYDFASQSEFWLSLELNDAYNQTTERLKKQYPFLSDGSVRRVANMAAYSWK
ncbi:hypothetical protein [Pontibacter sp. HSC-36F09]|uniref:hypothetical protein n=1 Tax=Pontibacter sp. HSC-36F09 TaxID=2910966 RepID=UPI00209E9C12|nr:hypothetical protein [Pontibacter sp. HSC-36F09]MCP2043147.1 hypothetical protein [Pontibacter sp. HSC-36F09]